jgi:hypothetical protein
VVQTDSTLIERSRVSRVRKLVESDESVLLDLKIREVFAHV